MLEGSTARISMHDLFRICRRRRGCLGSEEGVYVFWALGSYRVDDPLQRLESVIHREHVVFAVRYGRQLSGHVSVNVSFVGVLPPPAAPSFDGFTCVSLKSFTPTQ